MLMSRHSEAALAPPSVTVPFRTVLFSMVVLWATYLFLTTLRSMVMDLGLLLQLELGWRRLLVTIVGVAFTLLLWLLLRLFDACSPGRAGDRAGQLPCLQGYFPGGGAGLCAEEQPQRAP